MREMLHFSFYWVVFVTRGFCQKFGQSNCKKMEIYFRQKPRVITRSAKQKSE